MNGRPPKNSGPLRTTDHPLRPEDLDPDAAKVLRRLDQFGYHAYLVGGGVRDLLLGRRPKDFDVATSARPAEVRKLFRNCRLIGRRFRLAHVLFAGGKVIETATFRARPAELDDADPALITDDNEYGTAETDANRRDFTVNALFYDPATNEVIDFVGGLDDLKARRIRSIGDPVGRFREDPVRMLRAVKFAARLGLQIGEPERAALRTERDELVKAAVPRLLEEVSRLLIGGAAARSMELLAEHDLLELLLPEVGAYLGRPLPEGADPWQPMRGLLKQLDIRCDGQAALDRGVLLAALFWPLYDALLKSLPRSAQFRHLQPLAEQLVTPMALRLRVPRRDVQVLVGALSGQLRFHHARKRRTGRAGFARGQDYPAAFDLFELRHAAGQVETREAREWLAMGREFPPPSVEERRDARRQRPRERRGRRPGPPPGRRRR
jgi:poly(A) polymerase